MSNVLLGLGRDKQVEICDNSFFKKKKNTVFTSDYLLELWHKIPGGKKKKKQEFSLSPYNS